VLPETMSERCSEAALKRRSKAALEWCSEGGRDSRSAAGGAGPDLGMKAATEGREAAEKYTSGGRRVRVSSGARLEGSMATPPTRCSPYPLAMHE
jgi:hypothetical protein